jgi:hypothetical protein
MAANAPETRVVRLRRRGGKVVQDCDLYIGRRMTMGGWNLPQSDWANPFTVKICGSAEEACRRYEEWLLEKDDEGGHTNPLLSRLEELRGKTLGCWCKPGPCHGDILIRLLESGPEQ